VTVEEVTIFWPKYPDLDVPSEHVMARVLVADQWSTARVVTGARSLRIERDAARSLVDTFRSRNLAREVRHRLATMATEPVDTRELVLA